MKWWWSPLLCFTLCMVGFLTVSGCSLNDKRQIKQCLVPIHPLLNQLDLPSQETCRTITTFIRCVGKKSDVCDEYIEATRVLYIARGLMHRYCAPSVPATTTTPAPTTTPPPTANELFARCSEQFRSKSHRTLKEACRSAYRFLKCGDSAVWSHDFSVETFQLHAELLRNRAVFWQHCTRRALLRGGVGRRHCPYDVTGQLTSCLNITYWQQVAPGDVKTFCKVSAHILPCLSMVANGCHHVTMLQEMSDFLWNTFHLLSDECSQAPEVKSRLDYEYGEGSPAKDPASVNAKSTQGERNEPELAKSPPVQDKKPVKEKDSKSDAGNITSPKSEQNGKKYTAENKEGKASSKLSGEVNPEVSDDVKSAAVHPVGNSSKEYNERKTSLKPRSDLRKKPPNPKINPKQNSSDQALDNDPECEDDVQEISKGSEPPRDKPLRKGSRRQSKSRSSLPCRRKSKDRSAKEQAVGKSNRTKSRGKKIRKQKGRDKQRTNGTREQLMKSSAKYNKKVSAPSAVKRTSQASGLNSSPSSDGPTTSASRKDNSPTSPEKQSSQLSSPEANERREPNEQTLAPISNNKMNRNGSNENAEREITNSSTSQSGVGVVSAGSQKQVDNVSSSTSFHNSSGIPKNQSLSESDSSGPDRPALSGQEDGTSRNVSVEDLPISPSSGDNSSKPLNKGPGEETGLNSNTTKNDSSTSHRSNSGGRNEFSEASASDPDRTKEKSHDDIPVNKLKDVAGDKPLTVSVTTTSSSQVRRESRTDKVKNDDGNLQAPATVPTVPTDPALKVSSGNVDMNNTTNDSFVNTNTTSGSLTEDPSLDSSIVSTTLPTESDLSSNTSHEKSSKVQDGSGHHKNVQKTHLGVDIPTTQPTSKQHKLISNTTGKDQNVTDEEYPVLANSTDINYQAAVEPIQKNDSLIIADMTKKNTNTKYSNSGKPVHNASVDSNPLFEMANVSESENITDNLERPLNNDTDVDGMEQKQSRSRTKPDKNPGHIMDETHNMTETTSTDKSNMTDNPEEEVGQSTQASIAVSPDSEESDKDNARSSVMPDSLWYPWGTNCSRPWEGHRWCTSIMLRTRLGRPEDECRSLQRYIVCMTALVEACPGFPPFESIPGTVDYVTSVFEYKCPDYRVDSVQPQDKPAP